MKKWTIPGGVGSFYDGKQVNFAIGEDPGPNKSVEVVDKAEYDKVVGLLSDEIKKNDALRVAKEVWTKNDQVTFGNLYLERIDLKEEIKRLREHLALWVNLP